MLAGRQANFEARIWMWFASAKTSSCGPGMAQCVSEGCVWKSARSRSDCQPVCMWLCVLVVEVGFDEVVLVIMIAFSFSHIPHIFTTCYIHTHIYFMLYTNKMNRHLMWEYSHMIKWACLVFSWTILKFSTQITKSPDCPQKSFLWCLIIYVIATCLGTPRRWK